MRAELDRCIAQIGDLAKLRSEEELTHGHVMGRIAIELFGEQNNRTDEECITRVAEVVHERDSLRQHLHDEHQRHIGTMNECDVLRQDCFNLTEKVIPNLREQRDALRALLRDMEPHWMALTTRRIWTTDIAGQMASIRQRIDLALKDKP